MLEVQLTTGGGVNMEKWVISINEAQLASLSEEQRNLGTVLQGPGGEHFLVFRDGFVALKMASQLGATCKMGRSMPASSAAAYTPLANLGDGEVLVSEAS